jgi:hypothetical protein
MCQLDAALDFLEKSLFGKDKTVPPSEELLTFLSGPYLKNHIREVAVRALERQKGQRKTNYSADPQLDNPAIIFSNGNKVSANDSCSTRELFLRSSNNRSSFLLATAGDYSITAIDPLDIDVYRIVGLPNNDYFRPTSDAYLEKIEKFSLSRGETFVRSSHLTVVDVVTLGRKFLNFTMGDDTSYGLIFSKETGKLSATGCFDVVASKTISYLELLEQLEAPFLGDFAYKTTEDLSPIVRWRALSALNKCHDERTVQVLERFANDPTAFISAASQKILQQGRV